MINNIMRNHSCTNANALFSLGIEFYIVPTHLFGSEVLRKLDTQPAMGLVRNGWMYVKIRIHV